MNISYFKDVLMNIYIPHYAKRKYPAAVNIFTHLTEHEKYILNRLVIKKQRTKGLRFLEIGSYLGASSVTIASALRGQAILYCVDTWNNDAMSEGCRDTYQDFLTNTRTFSHHIKPLRGKSAELANVFKQTLDFIFFDGDHAYAGVKQDTDCWLPKLNSGGVVVYHDCGWAEGVKRVISEDIMPRVSLFGRLPNLFWGTIQ